MKPICCALLTCLMLAGTNAHALFIPFGPQNDVPIATVTGIWGWTLCDTRHYSSGNPGGFESLAPACGNGDLIMLAGRHTGSDILDVLAATTVIAATTDTGAARNGITTTSNGAEWYYNANYSWGFAGLGDVVDKFQCDVAGVSERDRLCWHTVSGSGGWRSGNNTQLNDSDAFEKLVFVAHSVPVPEPGATALMIGAILGLGLARRRQA